MPLSVLPTSLCKRTRGSAAALAARWLRGTSPARVLFVLFCSSLDADLHNNEGRSESMLARQVESYFGNVNCIGERSCYDEGKRAAETLTFDYMREHGLEVRAAWRSNLRLPFLVLT